MPLACAIDVNALELPEPIPNNPPQAVADSITVNEDGSVVFDPSANDTDPDGDPLWVKSVEGETSNGRTYWEEGGNVRYIPNPDFHGEDSFGYLVTDGLAEYEGTVSVTVTSVNDAPAGFQDAYSVGYFYDPEFDDPTHELTVLANDIDYDAPAESPALTVAALDATGATGKLAITADKQRIAWTIPQGFVGTTEFEYQAADAAGASTGWIAVRRHGPQGRPGAATAPAHHRRPGHGRHRRGRPVVRQRDGERHRWVVRRTQVAPGRDAGQLVRVGRLVPAHPDAGGDGRNVRVHAVQLEQ